MKSGCYRRYLLHKSFPVSPGPICWCWGCYTNYTVSQLKNSKGFGAPRAALRSCRCMGVSGHGHRFNASDLGKASRLPPWWSSNWLHDSMDWREVCPWNHGCTNRFRVFCHQYPPMYNLELHPKLGVSNGFQRFNSQFFHQHLYQLGESCYIHPTQQLDGSTIQGQVQGRCRCPSGLQCSVVGGSDKMYKWL